MDAQRALNELRVFATEAQSNLLRGVLKVKKFEKTLDEMVERLESSARAKKIYGLQELQSSQEEPVDRQRRIVAYHRTKRSYMARKSMITRQIRNFEDLLRETAGRL